MRGYFQTFWDSQRLDAVETMFKVPAQSGIGVTFIHFYCKCTYNNHLKASALDEGNGDIAMTTLPAPQEITKNVSPSA